MQYFLSTDVIADTIHALAALQILSEPDDSDTPPSPLLDPERRGQLLLMIRNAFADLVLQLIPYVEDADLDAETPSAPPPHQEPQGDDDDPLMKIALRTPPQSVMSRYGDNFHGILRRRLETAVALRVLADASLSPERTAATEERLRETVGRISDMLIGSCQPFTRLCY